MLTTPVALCATLLSGVALAGPAASAPASGPAAYVQPVDLRRLDSRLRAVSPGDRALIDMYLEAARREVLAVTDGCFPVHDHREHYRNLAERAKGAAVLSALAWSWPEELRRRCRQEAKGFVREVALAHRAKPNFDYEWQAAFWAAEAGIAGWFLWEELDTDLQDAVAAMVIFQADRFIDTRPKMGYRLDTEAETVSWNSTILTLATNMMPRHPHRRAWDEAAKRYVYNTFATPQDARNEAPGDDGRRIRDWIVGANLYEDLTLENHDQFHIEYVLSGYRFHIQGAALYWLSGQPLPQAFHHHARELYEKILLHCMTADGFFAYVSDNDWKRYHCWTESCVIHAYLAMLEGQAAARTLEERALREATRCWRASPKGFAYDNPYVCGKPWTSRIADAVLMHVTCPSAPPPPLSETELTSRLQGTFRLETPDLLTHLAGKGSYASCCRGRGAAWVCFVAPREDAWMVLPIAGNYQACIGGQPIVREAVNHWKQGPDWYWVIRKGQSKPSAEAFISLPDGSALHVQRLVAGDVPPGGDVQNTMAIEKPHVPFTMHFAGGTASWRAGQERWERDDDRTDLAIPGSWLNLQDRIGLVVCSAGPDRRPEIHIPKPGVRDGVRIHTLMPAAADQDLWIVIAPDQHHAETAAAAQQTSCRMQGTLAALLVGDQTVVINFGPARATFLLPSTAQPVELEPFSVSAWRAGHPLF